MNKKNDNVSLHPSGYFLGLGDIGIASARMSRGVDSNEKPG